MKKYILIAATILSTGILTSCKKEEKVKLVVPIQNLLNNRKDISWAD
ncbi:hypothetical protein GCM10023149_50190 [Mucilaginibacter gynuensis]|uniref:Uncharacterized protein n=1 Tax=Mucilaginibacter gynuensis TaxID=1302236 RepID=A0ABP8HHK8_9SPHI